VLHDRIHRYNIKPDLKTYSERYFDQGIVSWSNCRFLDNCFI